MRIIRDKEELEGTCYIEVLPGTYLETCWNEFVFSWSNIIEFSGEWIERLENLQNLMLSHELKFQCDLEKYKSIVEEVKTMRC